MKRILVSLGMLLFLAPVMGQVDIIVDAYPENSPSDLKIYITGSFNDWQAADEKYRLQPNDEGKYHILLEDLADSLIEFKFTAGSWATIESDHNSLPRPNRKINVAQTKVYRAEIHNWQELNRGGGSTLFVVGVVMAFLLSALLLAAFHRFHGRITGGDLKVPTLVIALSIFAGWYFLNYNVYQWQFILSLIRWVSLPGIALVTFFLYKKHRSQSLLPYLMALSVLVLVMVALSGLINGLAPIENYLSQFAVQFFIALLGLTAIRIEQAKPSPLAEPDKDTLPIAKEFDRLIHQEHIYTDQELTLEKLASQMGLHRNLLSKVINEHHGKSFSEFMIALRVQAFIDLARQQGMIEQYTFFGLAQRVGFNSKSAFNRAFKKITSQTPTQYFQATPAPHE